MPSTFIRVSGCNLRCAWCDSPKTSWSPEGGFESLDELEAFCARGPRHVVLTGGEPFLFEGMAKLSRRLRAAGHHVTFETAGTVWRDGVAADLMSLSPKLSHATPWERGATALAQRHERTRYQPEVLRRLMEAFDWQLKFVVRTTSAALELDVAEIEAMVAELGVRESQRSQVLLMPEGTDRGTLCDAYLALQPICQQRGFRLGQRLHIEMFGHTPGT